jgi:hypothetical protein
MECRANKVIYSIVRVAFIDCHLCTYHTRDLHLPIRCCASELDHRAVSSCERRLSRRSIWRVCGRFHAGDAKHSTVVFAHRLRLGWRRPNSLLRYCGWCRDDERGNNALAEIPPSYKNKNHRPGVRTESNDPCESGRASRNSTARTSPERYPHDMKGWNALV